MTLREALHETRKRLIQAEAMAPEATRKGIADRLGITEMYLIGLARRYDVTLPRPSTRWATRINADEARGMHMQGCTMYEIAARYRVSRQAISALAARDEWPPRPHRCDEICRRILALPTPIHLGEASRKLGVSHEGLRRRLKTYHPEVPLIKGTAHQCSSRCEALRAALMVASSYREATQAAGWIPNTSPGIVQRYKVYHPEFAWERAKGPPGRRKKIVVDVVTTTR